MANEQMRMGERVKQLRSAAGLTQQGLAVAAGLSMSVVSQIEQGTNEDPRLSTLAALARTFGVSLDNLAGFEPARPAQTPADLPPAQEKRTRKAPRPRGG
jgi:transcriptional regulator with XRE-family HTH domain